MSDLRNSITKNMVFAWHIFVVVMQKNEDPKVELKFFYHSGPKGTEIQ